MCPQESLVIISKQTSLDPMCPQERLVIISKQTGLSFALKRIGPLAAIIISTLYLLALYFSVISKSTENLSASVYSEILIKTTCQHLLLLVGFDTLIYQKYCDTPPILVGHPDYFLAPLPGSEALLVRGIGKENFNCKCCFYFLSPYLLDNGERKCCFPVWEVFYRC